MQRPVTWKTLVREVVEHRLPRTFSLRDIEAYRNYFAKHYPNNRFIAPKIRQSLQILRDQGLIEFLKPGYYRRTDASQPVFSPFFDPTVAEGFASRSQIARLWTETWAEQYLYCLNCPADELGALPAGTKVADLQCYSCSMRYQVKGKNGRFGATIQSSAYAPLLEAARTGSMPGYVLIEYDPRFHIVVFVDAIHGEDIGEDRIIPRRPLSDTARRVRWQGCVINITGLDDRRVRIVQPAGLERGVVRKRWRGTCLRNVVSTR